MNQIFFVICHKFSFLWQNHLRFLSFVTGLSSDLKEFLNFGPHLFWACFGTKVMDDVSILIEHKFSKVPRDVFNFSFLADRLVSFSENLVVLQILVDWVDVLPIYINF